MYKRMFVNACLALFLIISALHLVLLYQPQLLRDRLSERRVRGLWEASPIFKHLGVRHVSRSLSRGLRARAALCASPLPLLLTSALTCAPDCVHAAGGGARCRRRVVGAVRGAVRCSALAHRSSASLAASLPFRRSLFAHPGV